MRKTYRALLLGIALGFYLQPHTSVFAVERDNNIAPVTNEAETPTTTEPTTEEKSSEETESKDEASPVFTSKSEEQTDETAPAGETVRYCEEVGSKLYLYESDKQVYSELENKARIQAVKQLYKNQLSQFSSNFISEKDLIDTLTSTIQSKKSYPESDGLFTPCFILENPSVTKLALERFTKVNIGRLCNLNGNEISGLHEALRQRFTERLKRFDGSNDETIAYMVKDHTKLKSIEDATLYQYIHLASDQASKEDTLDVKKTTEITAEDATNTKPELIEASDYQCHDIYVYPIELYAASR